MQEVKVYLKDDGQLVLEKQDGTKVSVGIFNGGGYVTQLTYEPIEEQS